MTNAEARFNKSHIRKVYACLAVTCHLLVIERSRVRIPAGTAGEFSSPGSTFCADSYFGIRSTPVLPQ